MEFNLGQSGLLNIGTANFGTKYGVANISEGVIESDLVKIFEVINQNPKIGIDTASSYTQSEEIIGKYLASKNNKINTKISPENYYHPNLMIDSVKNSLLKTKQTMFNTVYLHGGHMNKRAFRESITEGLMRIKELELCKIVGISCYTENEILQSVKNFPVVEAFQVPENILDQRLFNSKELMRLAEHGIKFEIRSIFLQGSFLININEFPGFLKKYKSYFENLVSTANKLDMTVFDLALNYAMSIPWKSTLVVGINDFKQFNRLTNYNYADYKLPTMSDLKAPQSLTDPRNWKI